MSSSIAQAVADNGVHTGFWTNWSRGTILGATLTLDHQNGGLLTAFLALFVTATGACCWRIFCFFLHSFLSTPRPRDGLYHQQQAILRNTASGVGGIYKLLAAVFAWRRTADHAYARILPLLAATALVTSGFAVASIFSSRISTLTGNEVLLNGDKCIITQDFYDTDLGTGLLQVNPWISGTITTASTFTEQCYRDKGASEDCKSFVRATLPVNIDRNADCPFHGGICLSNTSNLRIDTGPMNSHNDFGINAPPHDRFTYRMITHCAPIKTDGYHVLEPVASDNDWCEGIHNFYYGENTDSQSPITSSIIHCPATDVQQGFILSPAIDFNPIPELQTADAITEIFFLGAPGIFFIEPVDDPWYSAHRPMPMLTLFNESDVLNTTIYMKDEFITVLGCSSQHQFCNPNLPAESGCTPLSGQDYDLDNAVTSSDIWKTDEQRASVGYISRRNLVGDMSSTVKDLGAFSLLSRRNIEGSYSAKLPKDQWQQDVQYWFNTSLAILQRQIFEQATGPNSEYIAEHSTRPKTDAEWARCRNQKVRSTNFASFSVFGLSLTLGIGFVIIVTSYALEPIVTFIRRRRTTHTYQRLEWTINETLQLQRLAHEELGFGTWKRADDEIPITSPNEKLAMVDLTDPEHPKLAAHATDQRKKTTPTLSLNTDTEISNPIPMPPYHSSSRPHQEGDNIMAEIPSPISSMSGVREGELVAIRQEQTSKGASIRVEQESASESSGIVRTESQSSIRTLSPSP